MTALLALLPCTVAVVAVMMLRQSGLNAAALALFTGMALWLSGVFTPMNPIQFAHAMADALVLGLLVGLVIVLGLLFVEVGSRGGGLKAIGSIVEAMHLRPSRALIAIALGVGVSVESLTGYGVSMFVTMPLLLALVDRTRAIWLALIGMSLMPWGALSIATLLGAEIADVPLQALAETIVKTSAPVAFVLPLIGVLAVGRPCLADTGYALLMGAALVAGIAATTHWIGVEIAGVGGGLAVLVLSLVAAQSRQGLGRALANPALLPYALLIAAIVLQKPLVSMLHAQGIALSIETGRVSFDLLGSPAFALAAAALAGLALQARAPGGSGNQRLLAHVGSRSWRALLSIFLFLLTARLLIETGAVAAMAQLLSELGRFSAAALVAILGGFGAFATGSGVASNALFMASAVATGHGFDAPLVFAALQHSGASHVAMASLPVVAILLAAMPDRNPGDSRVAMRAGLVLAALWIALVIASGSAQLAGLF